MPPALPTRKTRWLIVLTICMALVWGCRVPESAGTDRSRSQVILIVLDAARADRFGFGGYARQTSPHLDRLARSGLVSRAHFAHATQTRGSLPALLYSRYFAKALFPTSDSVPYDEPQNLLRRLDDEAISLSRLLADEGFATAAISAHSWLKPGTPFGREFDSLVDLSTQTGRYAPPAEHVVDRAIDWIDAHRDDDYFLYLHLMDTHFPHDFGPEAKAFWGSDEAPPAHLDGRPKTFRALDELDREEQRFLDALYDGSLLHADRQIERLSSHLAGAGLDRDTLVVITSDHGEHLFETPGRFAHGGTWLDPVARIPLVFYCPSRLEAATLPGFSGLVDVAPTILRLLEIPIPPGKSMDGRDLVAIARGEAPPSSEALSSQGVRTARYKLLVGDPGEVLSSAGHGESDAPPAIELFDLSRDPRELHDVAREKPAIVRDLLATYRARLGPKWQRFVDADDGTQPDSPFAIGARHFAIASGQAYDVAQGGEPFSASKSNEATSPVWLQSRHWRDDWIAGGPGAAPLEISFPLPDGRYEVTARVSGEGAIELRGSPLVEIRSSDQREDRDRQVRLGSIDVQDNRFSSTLHAPQTGEALRIRLLGFRPATAHERSAEEETLHLEQLRALGYVE